MIRHRLKVHFEVEEKNGYMDVVRKREPRLERRIQRLGDEHIVLAAGLDSLIEGAARTSRITAPFRTKIRGWIRSVRRHEMCEDDLIQDVFESDIGAED
jgi:hypothetical protein